MKHDVPTDHDELESNTRNQIHVGIEIGTTKICVCVAQGESDGSLVILGIAEAPSRGVRKGEIVDQKAAVDCIREALMDAEDRTGVEIEKICVAVTGAHIRSFNSKGSFVLAEEQGNVSQKHLAKAEGQAKKINLPAGTSFLHKILQSKHVVCRNSQLGIREKILEAQFHFIYGNKSRIDQTVRTLESLNLGVENIVLSSLASAQVVLTRQEKVLGALVFDIGGGTTDYLMYQDGEVRYSGSIAVGGDHITNDISIGLRVPIAESEILKIQAGSASTVNEASTITLKREGVPDYEIDLLSLGAIIQLRFREIFETVRREIELAEGMGQTEGIFKKLCSGIILTGGSSKLLGVAEIAEEVFDLPVQLYGEGNVGGTNQTCDNPQFSTVIGITKYAMSVSKNLDLRYECSSRLPKQLPSKATDAIRNLLRKPKREFRSNEEYLSALRNERESGKNLSRDGSEDLDVPTFLRKGADGLEIKHAKNL